MIFLTVGTQLGFDRLVELVDNWQFINSNETVIAQIADGEYTPKYMKYHRYLNSSQYNEIFFEADIVVSHAGMGSIISAGLSSKPIVIFPRRFELGEHRNDHQLSTCARFSKLNGCYIAKKEDDLISFLDRRKALSAADIATSGDFLSNNICTEISSWVTKVR